MTPFLEAHDAHQAPHDGASDPTRRAFVAACVAWARMRRRDLPRDALQLAATLYGAEWFAARARGRKVCRRLVARDVEAAARAARDPEVPLAALLCFRADVEGLRPPGARLWIDRPSPRLRRKVARAIRRSRRLPHWPAPPGFQRIGRAPQFRAALAAAVATCSLLPVAVLAHVAGTPWPATDVAARSARMLALLLLEFAAFHYDIATRRHRIGFPNHAADVRERHAPLAA